MKQSMLVIPYFTTVPYNYQNKKQIMRKVLTSLQTQNINGVRL